MTSLVHGKFRPLTVVLPTERVMKESIRMVLEHIYDREYPETAHLRYRRGGRNEAIKHLKQDLENAGEMPKWSLEFDLQKSFQNMDRHRLIQYLKEEIDDSKFFYNFQKVLYAGRGAKLSHAVPQSVVLSTMLQNIFLHKLDQEVQRVIQKYQVPISQRIRSVLRTGPPSPPTYDQENSGANLRDIIARRQKSSQRKSAFQSLVSSFHSPTSTREFRGDQRRPSFSM